MRKLTIGMATYDDFDGVFFTIQSFRMFHEEVMDDVEFVIINNSPNEKYHSALEGFYSHITQPVKYVQFTDYSASSIKNLIFEHASTPYVLVVDCHVLLERGSVKKLIDYFDSGKDNGNLLQGPLLHDDLNTVSTSFNDKWGTGMQGQWHFDEQYTSKDSEPFEIFAQGMGMFACRKDSWLGYNENFRGFGGEELYIHNKYRLHGKKTICLPFARWNHRFGRVHGAPYVNKWSDRYRNFIIGRLELGLGFDDVDAEFAKYIPEEQRQQIKQDASKLFIKDTEVITVGPNISGVYHFPVPRAGYVRIIGTDLYFPLSSIAITDTPTSGGCGCGK